MTGMTEIWTKTGAMIEVMTVDQREAVMIETENVTESIELAQVVEGMLSIEWGPVIRVMTAHMTEDSRRIGEKNLDRKVPLLITWMQLMRILRLETFVHLRKRATL
ncbi:unnamed protein product [Acanthoscelides obtectus]|uniref:Uncharacterized protein n=1 Tax=Acanthoscelides obtectus TaxID=200917 RepID=A0A9P0PHC3_ACAOB|nr:unnamed protein product [Acanthoscelides obtectus]CAK1681856.1 hypothetical protein AOBTE_LOCUS33314 [Acanthoscelides obtectus]